MVQAKLNHHLNTTWLTDDKTCYSADESHGQAQPQTTCGAPILVFQQPSVASTCNIF